MTSSRSIGIGARSNNDDGGAAGLPSLRVVEVKTNFVQQQIITLVLYKSAMSALWPLGCDARRHYARRPVPGLRGRVARAPTSARTRHRPLLLSTPRVRLSLSRARSLLRLRPVANGAAS